MDLEALTDLQTPWCIRIAVTLRIAERIEEGVDRADELANAAGCDGPALESLLRYLVGKGLFLEPEEGRFALNEAARNLMSPAARIGLDLEGLGGRMSHAWGTLLQYTRTGKSAYQDIYGLPFWDDLEAHPAIAQEFDDLMGLVGHGVPNARFEIEGGWTNVRTIVDVGGGTGAMLAEILKLRPWLQGTLVDMPRTVTPARKLFDPEGLQDRATARGQSFFDPLPPGADVYLLRGVLNDWPDEDAIRILRRCAEAAGPGGRVVILKSVKPEAKACGLVIEMVLAGGRLRSCEQFDVLAKGAGFTVTSARQDASGYFVAECRTSATT